jgi:hypothetical protein
MSHKITITLETGNAAFGDVDFEADETFEVGRILSEYAKRLMDGELNIHTMGLKLYDINGNPVGQVQVSKC